MKPCSDCPFKESTPLAGSPEWLEDLMKSIKNDKYFSHSCHQTDPNADGFKGGKNKRECVGHNMMLMNEMDNTPGLGGVYKNYHELFEKYLIKWLGKKTYEKMKSEHENITPIHIYRGKYE